MLLLEGIRTLSLKGETDTKSPSDLIFKLVPGVNKTHKDEDASWYDERIFTGLHAHLTSVVEKALAKAGVLTPRMAKSTGIKGKIASFQYKGKGVDKVPVTDDIKNAFPSSEGFKVVFKAGESKGNKAKWVVEVKGKAASGFGGHFITKTFPAFARAGSALQVTEFVVFLPSITRKEILVWPTKIKIDPSEFRARESEEALTDPREEVAKFENKLRPWERNMRKWAPGFSLAAAYKSRRGKTNPMSPQEAERIKNTIKNLYREGYTQTINDYVAEVVKRGIDPEMVANQVTTLPPGWLEARMAKEDASGTRVKPGRKKPGAPEKPAVGKMPTRASTIGEPPEMVTVGAQKWSLVDGSVQAHQLRKPHPRTQAQLDRLKGWSRKDKDVGNVRQMLKSMEEKGLSNEATSESIRKWVDDPEKFGDFFDALRAHGYRVEGTTVTSPIGEREINYYTARYDTDKVFTKKEREGIWGSKRDETKSAWRKRVVDEMIASFKNALRDYNYEPTGYAIVPLKRDGTADRGAYKQGLIAVATTTMPAYPGSVQADLPSSTDPTGRAELRPDHIGYRIVAAVQPVQRLMESGEEEDWLDVA